MAFIGNSKLIYLDEPTSVIIFACFISLGNGYIGKKIHLGNVKEL